jgi:hypothetical protein
MHIGSLMVRMMGTNLILAGKCRKRIPKEKMLTGLSTLVCKVKSSVTSVFSVQWFSVDLTGTADSTIPSPLIDTKRKALPSDDHHGENWDAYMSQNHSDAYPNHWQDSAPSHSEHATAEKVLDIPPSSLIIKPSNQYNPHSPPSPRDLSDRLSALSSNEDREAVFERHLNGNGKTSDFAVKESIRGIYQLWKFSSSSGISNGDGEKERFLQLIREALE